MKIKTMILMIIIGITLGFFSTKLARIIDDTLTYNNKYHIHDCFYAENKLIVINTMNKDKYYITSYIHDHVIQEVVEFEAFDLYIKNNGKPINCKYLKE